jgi:hypothetical protein
LGLQCRHCVRQVCLLDGPEEDAAACPIVVVEVHLFLEAEVQQVRLRETKDVTNVAPGRELDRYNWVEPWDRQFEHPPEVVVSVGGFVPDGIQCGVNLG